MATMVKLRFDAAQKGLGGLTDFVAQVFLFIDDLAQFFACDMVIDGTGDIVSATKSVKAPADSEVLVANNPNKVFRSVCVSIIK